MGLTRTGPCMAAEKVRSGRHMRRAWGWGDLVQLIAGAERKRKGPERSGPFFYLDHHGPISRSSGASKSQRPLIHI